MSGACKQNLHYPLDFLAEKRYTYQVEMTSACSSVGRAFGSHPRGQGFESLQVHKKQNSVSADTEFSFYSGPGGIRTARPCRRQGNKSPGATTTTAACGRNRERLPPGSVQKGTAQLQGKCPSAALFLHLLMEFVGNTALSPSGQARMLHLHHSGFTRWKASSACAQMQISSGPNVVSLVPATMPVSTAHATAFA